MPSGGKRQGAGRKTNKSKGLPTRERICFTLPSDTYEKIMAAKGSGTLSELLAELVTKALAEREIKNDAQKKNPGESNKRNVHQRTTTHP